jgi:hypothetical protein
LKTPHDERVRAAGTVTEVSRFRRGVGHPLWLASLALTPVSDPGAAVTTQYRYVTDQVQFRLAAMAGFSLQRI